MNQGEKQTRQQKPAEQTGQQVQTNPEMWTDQRQTEQDEQTEQQGLMDQIEALLEKPYWIIDILPEQVPAESEGQYSVIEKFYRKSPFILKKQADLLLKLNCYYDIKICQSFTTDGQISVFAVNPDPNELIHMIRKGYLDIIIGKADEMLITRDPDDTYMTLYNADNKLLKLLEKLTIGEGLFLWQPGQE